MEKGHNFIHDAFFKEIYSQTKYCLDIFRLIFTPKQFALFDWDTLISEATVAVDSKWKETRADLVFSVKLKQIKKPVRIIFLLEHKSYQNPMLLKQLLAYQVDRYLKEDCPIIPILVYHGREKAWRATLSFQKSLVDLTPEIEREFGQNIFNFTCKLLNIQNIDVQRGKARTLTSRPILYILRHIWQVDATVLAQLFKIGEKLTAEERDVLVKRSIDYARGYNRSLTWQVVERIEQDTIKNEEKKIMPVLKSFLDEAVEEAVEEGLKKGLKKGLEKGLEKGRQEVALKMIKGGVDLRTILDCTGLSEKELERLRKQAA